VSDAPPVAARGLVKRYGEIVAVDHVDLTVERGDVFGYLGPNGAGKTTSLRMLLGLIRPTEGSAQLFGRDPLRAGAKALEGVAGFVEGPTFYPYLSGRRNLRLLADYDGGVPGSRIEEVLEVVELRDRAKDKVRGYSHGMRQRLGIAASLLRGPKLLLLDEPTTGLDPAGMRDMRALVRRLASEGITVLLSSHLLAEVEELCNRVAIIRSGRIVYEGALGELLATAGGGYGLRATVPRAARDRRCPGGGGRASVPGRRGRGRRAHDRARAGSDRRHCPRPAHGEPRGALPHPHRGPRRRGGGGGGRAVNGVAVVYRWEVAKLLAQKRTYLGLGAATLIPLVFVGALLLQSGSPTEVPLGRYVRETGLVTPFVILFFMSIWGLPLITALVAGDIVAAESHNDTLKTILTRSRDRGEVFAGKALATLTYTIAVVVALGTVGVIAGSIAWGFDPLTSLSGTRVSFAHGLALLGGSVAVYILPLAGIASFGLLLSTITRNSAASVVGTLMWALLMQLLAVLPGLEGLRPYLLSTQFEAWHGFLRVPADWAPVWRALWVCSLYITVPVALAYLVFLRRDVAND
jgi:ABC-2 type transport system ATP-binding protein